MENCFQIQFIWWCNRNQVTIVAIHDQSCWSGLEVSIFGVQFVSKYIEFFTKNKDWKLTEYTFLSQAFKARKDKTLSPVFSRFIAAILTGDTEKTFQVVKSIDIENLGDRFNAPVQVITINK